MAEKTYRPTSGMASAAKRALKWNKEGKRGGTAVGLARANQLANYQRGPGRRNHARQRTNQTIRC